MVSIRRTKLLSNFLSTIEGESIIIKGQPFTWKRWFHASWIYERLDRGITRFNFARLYPNLYTSHGSFTFSDHCPIIVSTESEHQLQKPPLFRFQSFWTNYWEVEHMVRHRWKLNTKGSLMFCSVKKLKAVKNELKSWAKSTFRHVQENSNII